MAKSHIINFIQSLSTDEIKVAEDYLFKSFSTAKTNLEESKEIKLFKYILNNREKDISDSEISETTGTTHPSSLKTRLYEKVTEALTLDKHIFNTELFVENDQVIFKLKKRLLIFRILNRNINQKRFETLNQIINDIIIEGKEFEVYDLLIEALNARKYLIGLRSGLSEFEKINREVQFFDMCNKAVFNASDNYHRLILNTEFIKTLSQKEVDDHIAASIKQMEADYKLTNSQQVNYYLHIMRFALSERKKEYVKAIENCNKLISIIEKNKVVYRRERMGFALDNLCQFKIFTGKYAEAVKEAQKAQEYYNPNSINYIVSKEQEFYAYFYGAKYAQALNCIDTLIEHPTDDTGEFRKSKFIFYHAYVLFADKKYKEALQVLNKSLEIEKDKTRWNLSVRILNIMAFIQLEKLEEASRSLESLRKYVERTTKSEEIKSRDLLIIKILREMERDAFQYNPKNTIIAKLLKDLSEKNTPNSWEFYSSELIPFQNWITEVMVKI